MLFSAILPLIAAGLVTMYSFTGENAFFEKQILWILVGLAVFFILSALDVRFLRRTDVLVWLFVVSVATLGGLLLFGNAVKGAVSWLSVGGLTIQPADPAKLVVILILAKYFSRRHVEIAHIRHILVSGFYAFVPFTLVLLQPDFGSAMVIFLIWLGMTVASGISKKHLLAVALLASVSFAALWGFGFTENQKARIMTFLNPLADIQGAGYNAFQSTVAVGSGGVWGKGVGYGTQSRLSFLPEYETDFIFAAFAEEWGLVGILAILILFGIIVWRILRNSLTGESNFETLFGIGLAVFLGSHIIIHIGMNMGLLPVTGLPLPFVSYGGSHLLTEFAGLGILMAMRRYRRAVYRDDADREVVGIGFSDLPEK